MIALERQLEAILFYKGEPESKKRLAKLLGVTVEEVEDTAHILSTSLAERGVRLLTVNDELELVTAPEASELIQKLKKDELVRDLGKAGSETLAIILYKGPATRAQIDYIRGVNSSFILRNLMIRGLVERVPNPDNARSVVYQPTTQLLKEMGVTSVDALPDYEAICTEIEQFEKREKNVHEVDEQVPTSSATPESEPAASPTTP